MLLAAPATAQAGPFDAPVAPAIAGTLPPGFSESTVWSGLGNPTALRFAPDGRVFVASKSGIVNVFDGLGDTTPTQLADLRSKVHDFWDRGLLGLAIDPGFTSGRPYVYVLYTFDSKPWGDGCPSPPGATADGCVVGGRLSRLGPTGAETVLIEDFCQQYPSHSVGSIDFGPDGMLYVSSGDGASFNWADYGQAGNPCGDPANEGGALRSQSFRRTGGQAVSLDGTILRVNPDTGEAAAGNPEIGNPNPARRRIVAYGFRNPFRFAFRPGTGEIWSGDVGWNTHEEINRTPDVTQVRNYGWPCYEGAARMGSYDSLNLESCEDLYSEGTATAPYFAYHHNDKVVAGESCTTGSSSISGLAFYTGDAFGPEYKDALFFSDYSRNCIWVMPKGANGLPDPNARRTFLTGAAGPVFLTQGPDGALYYADLSGGTIRRISPNNTAPTARITANPTSGAAPLTVAFDARDSSDPQQQTLTYAWDLDGDGAYDDSTQVAPSRTYTNPGTVTVRLRVTDPGGLAGTASTTITVGGVPVATIEEPSSTTTWAVGDTIAFAGSARTSSGAALPASRLSWTLSLRHCSRTDANVCHTHAIQDYAGVASGSFVAPDHEYPSHLLLSLHATDPNGLTDTETVRLDPRTAEVALRSSPVGLRLSFASETVADAVHADRDRAVGHVGRRAVAPVARRRSVPLGRVERRRRAEPRGDGADERDRHIHRHVRVRRHRGHQPRRRRRDRGPHLRSARRDRRRVPRRRRAHGHGQVGPSVRRRREPGRRARARALRRAGERRAGSAAGRRFGRRAGGRGVERGRARPRRRVGGWEAVLDRPAQPGRVRRHAALARPRRLPVDGRARQPGHDADGAAAVVGVARELVGWAAVRVRLGRPRDCGDADPESDPDCDAESGARTVRRVHSAAACDAAIRSPPRSRGVLELQRPRSAWTRRPRARTQGP